MSKHPEVDGRTAEQLLDEARTLAPSYVEQWDPDSADVGDALLRIFSQIGEDVIERLDRAPQKHHVSFLDTVGFSREPPQASRVPLTFRVADGVTGTVAVPAGTRAVATARGDRPERTFEVPHDGGFEATPASLEKVYTVDPNRDRIVEHGDDLDLERETTLFEGGDLQRHALYVGHDDLLRLKTDATISIEVTPNETHEVLADDDRCDWQYFGEDGDGQATGWHSAEPDPNAKGDGLTLRFGGETKEIEVNGRKGFWLRCVVKEDVEMKELSALEIEEVSFSQRETERTLRPDAMFSNDVPLVTAEGRFVHPFGENPRPMTAFYVASEEAFSKEVATVTMTFEGSDTSTPEEDSEPVRAEFAPRLSWEYWNGNGWLQLDVSDTTDALRAPGAITFSPPSDLEPTRVAGHNGLWIRGRLTAGEYVRHVPPRIGRRTTGTPPRFSDVSLKYEYNKRPPERLVTENNLEYDELSVAGKGRIRPFSAVPDTNQTLYLGFDRALDGGPVNVLFSLSDVEYPSDFNPRTIWEHRKGPESDEWSRLTTRDGTESLTKGGIVGFVFSGSTRRSRRFGRDLHWLRARVVGDEFGSPAVAIRDLDVDTGTVTIENVDDRPFDLAGCLVTLRHGRRIEALSTESDSPLQPGRTTNYEPSNGRTLLAENERNRSVERIEAAVMTRGGKVLARRTGRSVSTPRSAAPCGRRLTSVSPIAERTTSPPVVRGIHPNTGWLDDARTIDEERLGSSDGTPDQRFSFDATPVLDEVIWVNELSVLSESRRQELEETSPRNVDVVTDSDGTVQAFWVRWQARDTLHDSTKDSRHYVLDRTIGSVSFGDGSNGRIPPRGRDNVRASYRTGGGIGGNIERGAITGLRSSIPFIDSVTNPEPAEGGAREEPMMDALTRAPKELRDRGRAISREDFERVAMAASRTIARVRCIPAMDDTGEYAPGWVTVVVVPRTSERRPVPSLELKRRVRMSLNDRAPAALTSPTTPRIVVRGPTYLEVSVRARVRSERTASLSVLEERITESVARFLHPLSGGPEGAGWAFGSVPCLSDLYALIERVESVDYAETLSMTFRTAEETMTVTEGESPPSVAPDTLIFGGTHDVGARGGS